MRFLEQSPKIKRWASEEFAIPYFLTTDKKWHRYFPDFYIEFETGDKFIVEIKPFSQRILKEGVKVRKAEYYKFIQNQTKWQFANTLAKENGMIFLVFDEYDLRKLGLQIPVPSTSVPKQKLLYEKTSPYGNSIARFIQPLIQDSTHEKSR